MLDKLMQHGIGVGGSGGGVKSIQSGYFILDINNKYIEISKINKNNSVLIVDFITNNNANAGALAYKIHNDTFLLFRTTTSGIVYINWQVIEFEGVKSRQEGLTTMPGSGGIAGDTFVDVAIDPVDVNKCLVVTSWRNSQSSVNRFASFSNLGRLTSSNNLRLHIYDAWGGTMEWQLLEFE